MDDLNPFLNNWTEVERESFLIICQTTTLAAWSQTREIPVLVPEKKYFGVLHKTPRLEPI